MVVSSGVAPRFAYSHPNPPSHSVPTTRIKSDTVAEVSRSRPPKVSVNALDRAGNIRPQISDPAELKKRIIGRLADKDISLAALEEIARLCDEGCESVHALPRRNNAIDPLSSRFLQADAHTAKSKGKGKAAATAPKRKALVTFGDSEDEDEIDDWCNVSPKDLKVFISLGKENEVVHFLQMRFTQIQQLATKVIAKAWIKAICPKKQANYPYVDSNPRDDTRPRRPRHDGPPRIPTFWPDVRLCRHKEPDHTKKSERTHLLVHLLRLQWTEKEWVESNGTGCEVPNLVKAGCWVQFLKDAFPVSKLDEVQGSNPEKAAQRKEYLKHIYDVAMQEENIRRSKCAGTTKAGVQYSQGPGWVPLGKEILRSSAQTNRRADNGKFDTPSSAAPATARSDSQSEVYTDTQDSDEHDEVLRLASPNSELEFAKDEEVERLVPFQPFKEEDVSVNPPEWRPVQDPVQKVEYDSQAGSACTEETPSTSVDEMGFYSSIWSDDMRNDQADRPLYGQYAGTAPHWYGSADYAFGPPQQSSVSGFPSSTSSAVTNGYRQNFSGFEPAVGSPSLQGRFASQMALCQGQFEPGYGELQQMGPSVPFPHVAAVGTAGGDSRSLGYGVPGLRYANAFGEHGTSGRFTAEPPQEMRDRWR